MKRVSGSEVRAAFKEHGVDAWLDLVLRHGKSFRVQGRVATCDTRLVEPLMLDRAHTRRRSMSHRLLRRIAPGSDGLLFLEGQRWEVQRRAVAPGVTREHVAQYADLIHANTLRWASSCEGGADLVTDMTRLGASIVLETGYGLDPADSLACEYANELMGYKHRSEPRDPRYRLDVLGVGADQLRALPWLCTTFVSLHQRVARMRGLVRRVLDQRAVCSVRRPNWIDSLAAERLPLRDLSNALNHLYGAYNTVDFMVAAALFDLARHPAWRARVRSELDSVLGERRYATPDDVPRLPLLWGAIKETLRLYPVATGVFRQTGAPLELEGERIRPGTQVVVMSYALHRHPDYWDRPEEFLPDRWARTQVPFAYIPFLIGPRKCMGQPLAELELLVRVSTILRYVDLQVGTHSARLTPYLLPRFDGDLPFRVTHAEPRNCCRAEALVAEHA